MNDLRSGDLAGSWASSAQASKRLRANKRRDTKPEKALASVLHRRGLRFRRDLYLRVGDARTYIDIAFTRQRVAVYLDSCFWHGCPKHGSTPKANANYWIPKLRENALRDRRVNDALTASGWKVLRVWEHEQVEAAADRVAHLLTAGNARAS